MNKPKDSKIKEKMTNTGEQGTRSYSTRGCEQKMVVNSMKTSKPSTTKIKRLNKVVIVVEENVKVVEVREE